MINYAGMKAEESKSDNFGQLPVGAYVGKTLKTEITGSAPDQSLVIYMDVAEGEYESFFMKKFDAQKKAGSQYGEVKFKGTYRLRIPNPENKKAQYPETDMRRFNDMIAKYQNSNPGITLYDQNGFNEQRLKGLLVGFSTLEDSYNGSSFTRIGRLENVDDVRNGNVRPMEARRRNEAGDANDSAFIAPPAPTIDPQSGFIGVETDELPF